MKYAKLVRVFSIVIVLSLLLFALPASPVQAAREIVLDPEEGSIGDTIAIVGTDFNKSTPDYDKYATIYFSSQEASTLDDIDEDVTTYEVVKDGVWLDEDGAFETTFTVPSKLDDGDDDEDVVSGTYYVYVCHYGYPDIRAYAEFNIPDGEIPVPPVGPFTMAYFAKYDGIDGESIDDSHDKWIDILSIDWGVHQPTAGASGMSRRRGSAEVDDMVITFAYEKSAPKLAEKCLMGAVIPRLEIELTADFGGTRATYLRYEFKNVMVTSYDVSGNVADGVPPTVTVANNFEEIRVTYSEYAPDGSHQGNVEFEWKVEEGE